jgi:hypothetical protein
MDVVHYFIGTPPASKQLGFGHWHVKLSELKKVSKGIPVTGRGGP